MPGNREGPAIEGGGFRAGQALLEGAATFAGASFYQPMAVFPPRKCGELAAQAGSGIVAVTCPPLITTRAVRPSGPTTACEDMVSLPLPWPATKTSPDGLAHSIPPIAPIPLVWELP